ncbi:MAG TPA: hypothetical protein V6D20_22615, partial [Candidatus Obscuribacterales bacterium]
MSDTAVTDVQFILNVAYHNGFGFQAEGTSPLGSLVIGTLSGPEAEAAQVQHWRKDLDTEEVYLVDFLGVVYVKILWTLYDRIPEIIQYALDQGH